jgi:hypothetical protein
MDVDRDIYARGTVPARDAHTIYVEDEAQGLARRIRATSGGEREFNIGRLASELRTLRHNQANGYSGWEFRIKVLQRTLELLGVQA